MVIAFAGLLRPVEFSAYDGSHAGTSESAVNVTLGWPVALATWPRPPVISASPEPMCLGTLDVEGDMYLALSRMTKVQAVSLSLAENLRLLPALGGPKILLTGWLRRPRRSGCTAAGGGRRHSLQRDAKAVSHHYDVSNRF